MSSFSVTVTQFESPSSFCIRRTDFERTWRAFAATAGPKLREAPKPWPGGVFLLRDEATQRMARLVRLSGARSMSGKIAISGDSLLMTQLVKKHFCSLPAHRHSGINDELSTNCQEDNHRRVRALFLSQGYP